MGEKFREGDVHKWMGLHDDTADGMHDEERGTTERILPLFTDEDEIEEQKEYWAIANKEWGDWKKDVCSAAMAQDVNNRITV